MRRVLIILLFLQVTTGFGQTNDITLLRDIYHNRNTNLDKSVNFITETATPLSMALPAELLIYAIIEDDKDAWDNGLKSVLSLGSAMVVTYSLKYAIDRQRPYERYADIVPYADESSASFPSGHTTAGFATATSLTMLKPKWYVIIPAYGYAGLIAYSRMHLGMHYPSDVLFGALIGSGCSFASFKINKLLKSGFLYPHRK